ncbi:MAG: hypothetical protein ACI3ZL_08235 [Candidatus Cryptobacteroides sp.]
MKIRNIFLATAFIFAVACVKENPVQEDGGKTDVDVTLVPMEFTTEIETKTSLQGGTDVHWISGDKICIFTEDNTNSSFETSSEGESAVFTGTAPVSSYYYALYPYRSGAKFDNSTEQIATTLFADQKAKVGSFADDVAIMVAKADANKLSFKNVCSHVKFTLPADFTEVKSMTLMGNKNEVLCGTFSIDWNGGNPTITMTSSETYVTLRNEGGTALTPGDYYFTVLPVTFEDGFTVILSMTDGSQKAITTTKTFDFISSRNKILVMNTPAAEKFTDHMNYFVKYNDGFSLDFGGVAINKEAYPGGVLVNDTKGNLTIKTDGVYFICTISEAHLNYNLAKSLIFIGEDEAKRSTLIMDKQVQPADEGTLVLFANLNLSASQRPFAQNNSSPYKSFGSIICSNSHFKISNDNFIRLSVGDSVTERIVIEDCEIGCGSATMYVVNLGAKAGSINNLIIKNNVFYPLVTVTMTDFKLVNGTNSEAVLNDFEVSNNTFYKTVTKNTGVILAGVFNGYTTVTNNFFVEIHPAASTVIYLVNPTTVTNSSNRTINNNYIYSSLSGAKNMTFNTNLFVNTENKTPQVPRLLDANPLNESWDPENGVFGAYKSVTYNSNVDNIVPSGVGAQRADMSATPGTASYRYPSVDLGTF